MAKTKFRYRTYFPHNAGSFIEANYGGTPRSRAHGTDWHRTEEDLSYSTLHRGGGGGGRGGGGRLTLLPGGPNLNTLWIVMIKKHSMVVIGYYGHNKHNKLWRPSTTKVSIVTKT